MLRTFHFNQFWVTCSGLSFSVSLSKRIKGPSFGVLQKPEDSALVKKVVRNEEPQYNDRCIAKCVAPLRVGRRSSSFLVNSE